ncbi:SIS domain-containing protein [Alteribacter populi]|uniref:SIS domain-containing protein n=1 Tax=Alteribacter populi TaxID=2011011 RepID=UPI000BBB2AFF|nr:SIS domain-containing protein [Alteribacter populi]
MIRNYIEEIQERLTNLLENQRSQFEEAVDAITQAIEKGGVIHLFGAGHSHLLGEELFYRAGGLVPVNPILEESLMLHEGAVRSSELERKRGYARTFIEEEDIRDTDVVIVSSTSGRNPVPIDVALYAREQGAFTIGLTSVAFSKSQPSRHESGIRLLDAVDLTFDNLSVEGDAVLRHDQVDVPFGPTSSVVGITILNAIFADVITNLAEKGHTPPVFLSGNVDGADDHNQKLINQYKNRIPRLG